MSAELTSEEGAALLTLARAAIEERLFEDGALERARGAITLTPALTGPRACFVTLYALSRVGARQLRGCIGSTEALLPAHEAVVQSALDAAFTDPRFPPLTREEYPDNVVAVSALTPMIPVPEVGAIVAGRDGVVLDCDGRRAVFLPEVASEQGWDRLETLEHLARKAGLPADAWRRARLSIFRSERFGENEKGAARIRRS
jgi:AmmeMemoRadiSam system protein A